MDPFVITAIIISLLSLILTAVMFGAKVSSRDSNIKAHDAELDAVRAILDANKARLDAFENLLAHRAAAHDENAKKLDEHAQKLVEVQKLRDEANDPLKRLQHRAELARQAVQYGKSKSSVVGEQFIHAVDYMKLLDMQDNGKRDYSDVEVTLAVTTEFGSSGSAK